MWGDEHKVHGKRRDWTHLWRSLITKRCIIIIFVVFAIYFCCSLFLHTTYSFVHHAKVRSLSLKHKIGQMIQLEVFSVLEKANKFPGHVTLKSDVLDRLLGEYGIGSFLNSPFSNEDRNPYRGWNSSSWFTFINVLSTEANKRHPHHIPILFALDSVHGANYVYGATIFPHNIGQAATFNIDLVRDAAFITASDTRSAGVLWNFAPVLDLGINPLWARFYETFGEDPYLISSYATAIIQACTSARIACTAKHFIGYSAPLSGKDRNDAWIPDRQLLAYFVPPFRAAIRAGVSTVMVNSGSVNGVPVHASHFYLTSLLRKHLNFQGVIISDWTDIDLLYTRHRVASNLESATLLALSAGVDINMVATGSLQYADVLYDLASKNATIEKMIDASVTRILQLKDQLQVSTRFSESLPPPNTLADRKLSLKMVEESVTLLKNEHGVLPLDANSLRHILLVGPTAHSLKNQCGGWTIRWQGATDDSEFAGSEYSSPFSEEDGVLPTSTLLEGLRKEGGPGLEVSYVEGCGVRRCKMEDLRSIEERIQERRDVDAVIVAIGEPPYAEVKGDIDDLTLSSPQLLLVKRVVQAAVNSENGEREVPVILVMIGGRPRVIGEEWLQEIPAIVMAYLPGLQGGEGIARILLGKTNPSGRLPFSYPSATGDIVPYFHRHTGKSSPLYPFGHGLSYTRFEYTDLRLTPSGPEILLGENVQIEVTVTNVGREAGKEVVLLYLSDLYASIAPEVKLLKRFHKTQLLLPNESARVTFKLQSEDFSFIGVDNTPVIEAGEIELAVGPMKTSLTLVPSPAHEYQTQLRLLRGAPCC